jgi:hypothetical protein
MSTVAINAYAGWTEAQLRERCRELVRIASHKDILIAKLSLAIPGGVDSLPVSIREEVRRIRDQWDD